MTQPNKDICTIFYGMMRYRWPNQQCHSTEGRWLINQVKGRSNQAKLTKWWHFFPLNTWMDGRWSKECNKNYLNIYSSMKIENTQAVRRQRAKPSKIKAQASRPTCIRTAHTIVRATTRVNGETQNWTPHHAQTPKATVIKDGRGDYVVDPYTCAKVRHNSPRRIVSAYAWLCAPKTC